MPGLNTLRRNLSRWTAPVTFAAAVAFLVAHGASAANADALFVFHRDVEAARKKLADGYTAVR